MEAWLFWVLMLLLVFIPPLLYMAKVRNLENFNPEPWGGLLGTFLKGAILAVIASLILEIIVFQLYGEFIRVYDILERGYTSDTLVLACIIAPFVEEAAKGAIVWRRRKHLLEEEDGMIYGASAGLGFSATENLVYGLTAYAVAGAAGFIVTVIIRSVSAVFLHASASGIVGHGIAKKELFGTSAAPFFFAAVGLHAGYNFLASLSLVLGPEYGVVSLVLVVLIGVWSYRRMKRDIVSLDHGQ